MFAKSINKRILAENLTAYAFIFPAVFLITLFIIYPIGFNFYLSFHEWDALSANKTFIGLNNYKEMINDEQLHQAIKNTIVFTVTSVPLTLGLALFLAVLLDKEIRGRAIIRTAIFTPVVTSYVAAGLVFVWMFNYNHGVINELLMLIGLEPVNWLQSTGFWAMTAVVLLTVWKNTGYFMVIFLAGLQSIPKEYYEAASLEGAGSGWKGFWFITWPLLKPTTLFVSVIALIFTFRSFEQFYVMTKGGPMGTTKVLVYYMYEQAFKLFNMGYAAAVAMVLLVLVLVITLLQFRLIGDRHVQY